MESHITATAVVRSFSEILNRVRYRGESFVVERGGEPVCRITPAGAAGFSLGELAQLLRDAPRPDDAYLSTVQKLAVKQPRLPKAPWPR
jgi:antitoxin (DNA-binding transcriptional repressor) of toxin-antitoxin stability system